jgi:hypothetical protein
MPRQVDESRILKFYRSADIVSKPELAFSLAQLTLTNTPLGIGDTVVLGALPRVAAAFGRKVSIYSHSGWFKALTNFNPYYTEGFTPFWVAADALSHSYDLGNGHFIQRIQRAFGFRPELRPHGCIVVPDAQMIPGRVVFHFEAGAHAKWQRENVHPRARQVYPETMDVLQRFVHQHPKMQFYEVGKKFSGMEAVGDWTNIPLEETIRRMSSCEYFIGIMSGPLHIAVALRLKVVTITNFPDPTDIYLPTLKDIDLIESEWFYPQSAILHQEGEGELVAEFSLQNLERAINGDIYPYWSERYLCLIEEQL